MSLNVSDHRIPYSISRQQMQMHDLQKLGQKFLGVIQRAVDNENLEEAIEFINDCDAEQLSCGLDKEENNAWHLVIRHTNSDNRETVVKILHALYNQGVNINARNNDYKTPLHLACEIQDNSAVQLVKFLIPRKADVNIQDNEGNMPLHTVFSNAYLDVGEIESIVKTLIDESNNNSINHENCFPDSETAFDIACRKKYYDIAILLLEKGATYPIDVLNDIDSKSPKGTRLLNKLKELLNAPEITGVTSSGSYNPTIILDSDEEMNDAVGITEASTTTLDSTQIRFFNAIKTTAETRKAASLEKWIKSNNREALKQAKDEEGNNALHVAFRLVSLKNYATMQKVVNVLINLGLDQRSVNKHGKVPQQELTLSRSEIQADRGDKQGQILSSIQTVSRDGNITPLSNLIETLDLELLKEVSTSGNNLLHYLYGYATLQNWPTIKQIIDMFCKLGVDENAVNKNGKTPKQMLTFSIAPVRQSTIPLAVSILPSPPKALTKELSTMNTRNEAYRLNGIPALKPKETKASLVAPTASSQMFNTNKAHENLDTNGNNNLLIVISLTNSINGSVMKPIIEDLIKEEGKKINAKNKEGKTALHLACNLKDNIAKELVEILVNSKANVSITDNAGNTPLQTVCSNTSLLENCISSIVLKLTSNKVYKESLNNKNLNGETALDICFRNKLNGTAQILIDKGTSIPLDTLEKSTSKESEENNESVEEEVVDSDFEAIPREDIKQITQS